MNKGHNIQKNIAEHLDSSSEQTLQNTKFANASYSWQTFLIDFYRRVRHYYKFDYDNDRCIKSCNL